MSTRPRLCFFLLLVPFAITSLCQAQAPALKAGSAEAARFFANQANARIQSDMDWRSSKKLSMDKLAKAPEKPPGQESSMQLDDVTVGDVGMVLYWQFQVQSLIDKKNVLLRLGQQVYWLEDFPTDGLADDDKIYILDPVRITESKSYTAVNGAKRTVKAFRMMTKPDHEKHLATLAEQKAKIDRDNRVANSETFTFTGGNTLQARFVDYKKGKVTLEDVDGKMVEYSMAEFDPKTAAKIRELFKRMPKEPEPKKKK